MDICGTADPQAKKLIPSYLVNLEFIITTHQNIRKYGDRQTTVDFHHDLNRLTCTLLREPLDIPLSLVNTRHECALWDNMFHSATVRPMIISCPFVNDSLRLSYKLIEDLVYIFIFSSPLDFIICSTNSNTEMKLHVRNIKAEKIFRLRHKECEILREKFCENYEGRYKIVSANSGVVWRSKNTKSSQSFMMTETS